MRTRTLHCSRRCTAALAVCAVLSSTLLALAQTETQAEPPGADKSAKTRVLEVGAQALQSNTPVAAMDIYLNGFHPMKAQPEHQMEAHHFCRQVNEDFAQCALFDGNGRDANLTGSKTSIASLAVWAT